MWPRDLYQGSVHANAWGVWKKHQKLRVHTIVFAQCSSVYTKMLLNADTPRGNVKTRMRRNSRARDIVAFPASAFSVFAVHTNTIRCYCQMSTFSFNHDSFPMTTPVAHARTRTRHIDPRLEFWATLSAWYQTGSFLASRWLITSRNYLNSSQKQTLKDTPAVFL